MATAGFLAQSKRTGNGDGSGAHAGGDQCGQSILEFALMLPLLFLMLAGTVDLGRGLRDYIVVTNAVGVGARYGAIRPSDTSGIQARVQNAVAGTGVTGLSVSTAYPSGNVRGNPIRVTASFQFDALLGAFLGHSTLTVSSRVEQMIL